MPRRKLSPRQEYRQKQRDTIVASPSMATQFPKLKSVGLLLSYFDALGNVKQGEMKCKLNVEHAKSVLWFACPGAECVGGDFDLTQILASAVAARRKVAIGEIRCGGKRTRGDKEPVPCATLLRYKLTLDYA